MSGRAGRLPLATSAITEGQYIEIAILVKVCAMSWDMPWARATTLATAVLNDPPGSARIGPDGLTQRFGVDRIAVVDAGIVQRGDERVVDGVCLCWRGEGRGAENARGCRQQSQRQGLMAP